MNRAVCSWIERGVETSIRIESANAIARLAAERCEITPHQNLPVRLQSQRMNRAVCSQIERGVRTSIRIEPANAIAGQRQSAAKHFAAFVFVEFYCGGKLSRGSQLFSSVPIWREIVSTIRESKTGRKSHCRIAAT